MKLGSPLKNILHNTEDFVTSKDVEQEVFVGTFSSTSGPEKNYFKKIYPKEKTKELLHLVLLHDFGEFHGSYIELVNYFSQNHPREVGITLIDFKGHGLSSGTRSHIEHFSNFADDLKVFFEKLPYESFVLGHGLGALAILDFIRSYENLSSKKISGLILSNPFIGMAGKFPAKIRELSGSIPKKLWSKVRVPYHMRGEYLTHDFSKQERYDDNPLINRFVSLSLLFESMKASNDIVDISYYLQHPVLALVSREGSLVRLNQVELFFRAMPQSKVEIKRYEMGHDLYNESGRDILFSDIAKWIFKTTSEGSK